MGAEHRGFRLVQGADGRLADRGLLARKAATVVYLMPGFENFGDLLERLGPNSIGKSCLYIKRLADVDAKVLRQLVETSVRETRKKYG